MFDIDLRSVTIDDASNIFILIDKNRNILRQWLTFIDDSINVDFTTEYIGRTSLYNPNGDIVYVIEYNHNIVGLIGFEAINNYRKKAELGYWLCPEYQGMGIMKMASSLALKFGFEKYSFNRIEIKCACNNIRSIKIAEYLGFTYEGTERDGELLSDGEFTNVCVYSMLKREYNKKFFRET